MGDVARLSKQLESTFALASLLEDHGEEIESLGLTGKVPDEVEAESLRVVDATVEKLVEDVVSPIVELVDEVVVELVVETLSNLVAAGVADMVVRVDRLDGAHGGLRG
jgi:hypothetical protein